ncbi:carboxypeptidase regulatory-like domain-containing protein [Desertifilum sp. FACHB-1129]|uniref:carboxypeptidase-like regulatory domain-containing protein n=1 Tax=Desertifilum TaxID=1185872 RepID=UPI0009F47215|nr:MULTISPECIES: hypothetical protein [Desertifilum]MBD2312901.1 carboxypeptidase regulatory-like domain-containing protein [Desertifilum sp. FACHB-1129]MBD2323777.1 carboxypeptidase regulatory-like domain-containing protein [Desertifilum sp. FACHB-866]MBD2333622.1 carboxypeptidase regulatory-like domain-containing protein [Desertifilum sp. FACHB-868]MDA0210688.1 carboxypeptidase regulatory-like domain-containing protein [Cyanobacteria bacterium FC1]
MQFIPTRLLTPVALLALFGIPVPVLAHGVILESQPTEAQVYEILAIYDTGEPMQNAQVAIYPPGDATEPQIRGVTDNQGRFWFAAPQAGDWEVQVLQAGHGERMIVSVAQPQSEIGTEVSPEPTLEATPSPVAETRSETTTRRGYTPLQTGVMMGSVIWGCVGTALYCARGKKQ